MCSGQGCKFRLSCHRFTATFNPNRQSIFTDPPIKDGECKYFWDNENESIFLQYDEVKNQIKKDNNLI